MEYEVLQGDDDCGDDLEMIFEGGDRQNDQERLVGQAEQYGLAAFFTEPDLDAFDRARRFVRWQWRAIEAVARALIERTTLSGDEVREIYRGDQGKRRA